MLQDLYMLGPDTWNNEKTRKAIIHYIQDVSLPPRWELGGLR